MSADGVKGASPTRSQSLAEVALTYLAALDNTHPSQGAIQNTPATLQTNGHAVHNHYSRAPALPPSQPTTRTPSEQANVNPGLNNAQTTTSTAAAISQRPLPSLLRYVDNDLMLSVAHHNNPSDPKAVCTICHFLWDRPPIDFIQDSMADKNPTFTTFLPLSPCGHWVHYRCLISVATKNWPQRDKCMACGTQLFHWEGITALTLATRTSLAMEDNYQRSSATAYEADCAMTERIIHEQFFAHLALPSPHTDGSPDLVQCYNDVLNALRQTGMPRARWLKYETQTGHLLWAILVAIKTRRYMMEQHAKIVATEAWKKFEQGCATLQQNLLKEVRN